jgi:hypothetical protein
MNKASTSYTSPNMKPLIFPDDIALYKLNFAIKCIIKFKLMPQ